MKIAQVQCQSVFPIYHGARVVFYQVHLSLLEKYIDIGLSVTKLGEEALVPLQNKSLGQGVHKSLKQAARRAEREQLEFEIVAPGQLGQLLPSLKKISDQWLETRKVREKGFSLGKFDEEYILRFPIAIVRQRGSVIAFANLWTTKNKEVLSFDLMRHLNEVPGGLMDFLLVSLITWGTAQGYAYLNLGIAPLSGIDARPAAATWNKFASFVFRNGGRFYNFKGLRSYKEKFAPEWQPVYLAAPGGFSLPSVLTDLTILISGGAKGILSK